MAFVIALYLVGIALYTGRERSKRTNRKPYTTARAHETIVTTLTLVRMSCSKLSYPNHYQMKLYLLAIDNQFKPETVFSLEPLPT